MEALRARAEAGDQEAQSQLAERKQYQVRATVLSVKLDAPAPCRLDASDLDLICYASADCLHQHLQVI